MKRKLFIIMFFLTLICSGCYIGDNELEGDFIFIDEDNWDKYFDLSCSYDYYDSSTGWVLFSYTLQLDQNYEIVEEGYFDLYYNTDIEFYLENGNAGPFTVHPLIQFVDKMPLSGNVSGQTFAEGKFGDSAVIVSAKKSNFHRFNYFKVQIKERS